MASKETKTPEMDPNDFHNLQSGWHKKYGWPLRIREDDGGEQLLVSPDNDRGIEGEAYWVPRDEILFTP